MSKKLLLIDGNSIAYRAFFALPLLSNEKGIHTNAIYGFSMMLLKVLEQEKPSHILVAFDAGKTTFRHNTFEEYKGGRQKTPPELSEQFPFLRELLDAFNISRYELDQYEADDIIGTLSKRAEEEGMEVVIISGDKDLLQLVTDHVKVLLTRKGITDVDTYDKKEIERKYGLKPGQIIDMKGLMGDSSDNIPGVPGVGEKTAIKLLKEFETVEKVLASIEQVSGKKLKERLSDNHEQALMSKKLATIIDDAPIEVNLQEIEYSKYNSEKVLKIFKELGFNSLLDRLDMDDVMEEQESLVSPDYTAVNEISKELFTESSAVVIEVVNDNYHNGIIEGIAITNEQNSYFISTETALKSPIFKEWAEDETYKKIVFDAKSAIVVLSWKGIHLKGIELDALIASYILNPADSHHEVADIALRYGAEKVPSDESIYGKGAKRQIPAQDKLADHLIRKTNALYKMKSNMLAELKRNDQLELFLQLEMPLSIVLAKMEAQGVKVDVERLKKMGEELTEQLASIESTIYEIAGESFNINSPKQLGVILFEKLGLPIIKKTKTGYSTSAEVLEKLMDEHEIIPKILHYRQLGKLNSTYIEGLLKVVYKDTNKIHTRFNQALTQTGRLSSIEPNLQNIPIRLEEGRKIRQAFVPSKEGWLIFAADYSQIELRVLAHIAGDDRLIEAFNQDKDIHTSTAMDVFHVPENEVTANMRRQAKAVNFGIVYGISDYGLSQNLGITRKQAQEFIDKYLDAFPGVRAYMSDVITDAKQKGYVSTLMHRRRYIPDITNRNFNKRSFAERTAMNTPIQGSAADIIKKAMIDMDQRLEEEKLEARLLLQVHDELIFEAPEEEIEVLKRIVPDVMENAIDLKVPLKVDYSYGPTWYDAK